MILYLKKEKKSVFIRFSTNHGLGVHWGSWKIFPVDKGGLL